MHQASDALMVESVREADTEAHPSGDEDGDASVEGLQVAALEDSKPERDCVSCKRRVACHRALCDRQVLFLCPSCSQRE